MNQKMLAKLCIGFSYFLCPHQMSPKTYRTGVNSWMCSSLPWKRRLFDLVEMAQKLTGKIVFVVFSSFNSF